MASSGDLVLVTGACGYLACHVIQQLQRAGYRVRGTVRKAEMNDDEQIRPIRELCPDAKHPVVELFEADLLEPETWPAAVAACSYVIHTASPFPVEPPDDPDDVIKPAVEGTLSVLRAARDAGCVKRVVMTSSAAAVCDDYTKDDRMYNETDWTDVAKDLPAYTKSKTLAEKAAWDFVAALSGDDKFELAVMNPGFFIGPVLNRPGSASTSLPKLFMERALPAVMHMCLPTIDIRDVAAAHVAAMTLPEAAGKRHILANGTLWFRELAQFLYDEFHANGYDVLTEEEPAKPDAPGLFYVDNTRMLEVLKIKPRPLRESFVEMARGLIDAGFIVKK